MTTAHESKSSEQRSAQFSFVNEHPPADPVAAARHFAARLAIETDASDVALDLKRAPDRIQVIDARSAEQFAECHMPGAISLPYRSINAQTTASLDRSRTMVVYCWGPGCNAAHKGAARLAELGFHVKEMIGGIEYWRHEGYPVEGTLGENAPFYG